jgi:hypothetical protein
MSTGKWLPAVDEGTAVPRNISDYLLINMA